MARGIFRVVWLVGLLWAFGMFVSCGSYLIYDIQTARSSDDFIILEFIKTLVAYAAFGIAPGLLVAKGATWAMRRLAY